MLFSYIYFWGESVFSEDVNPDFVHQSNEIDKTNVLSFGKCSDAKTILDFKKAATKMCFLLSFKVRYPPRLPW